LLSKSAIFIYATDFEKILNKSAIVFAIEFKIAYKICKKKQTKTKQNGAAGIILFNFLNNLLAVLSK